MIWFSLFIRVSIALLHACLGFGSSRTRWRTRRSLCKLLFQKPSFAFVSQELFFLLKSSFPCLNIRNLGMGLGFSDCPKRLVCSLPLDMAAFFLVWLCDLGMHCLEQFEDARTSLRAWRDRQLQAR